TNVALNTLSTTAIKVARPQRPRRLRVDFFTEQPVSLLGFEKHKTINMAEFLAMSTQPDNSK
ncbi:MAG: hypothetical protein QF600_08045, partial [Verrucomicrobiota bacterium]|nr:hypothetical protein [Verrucomicrobiota bacterium]